MSERRILCVKPVFRLEWRGQDGQDEAEQCEHCLLTLGDSLSYFALMCFRRPSFKLSQVDKKFRKSILQMGN